MKNRSRRPPPLKGAITRLENLVRQRHYSAAEKEARDLLKHLPSHPFVLKSLSFGLIGQQRYDEALPLLLRAIEVDERDAELHNNLGIVYSALLYSDKAIAAFDRALELAPADPDVWKNKGAAFCHTSRWREAVPCLLKAVETYPEDNDEAINLLAGALLNAEMNEEAYNCFTVLADAEPENAYFLGALTVLSLRTCRWGLLAEKIDRLRGMTKQFELPAIAPFHALSLPGISEDDLRKIAACHAAATIFSYEPVNNGRSMPVESAAVTKASRLRIGYLSYDFRDHPVGRVIPQIIELHDRSSFEIFGYSMSSDDGSETRRRLSSAFDHFVEIDALGIVSGAERIASDRIDILVDLQGWTSGNRAAMLALRPSSVIVSWLGYAGTMGDPKLSDFLIGDPVVTPVAQQPFYSENIVQLPECYLPLDSEKLPPPSPGRSAAGLPENAFVFCSMNNCYKFNPEVFDVWCNVLKAAPGSVLWISNPGEPAATNLKSEVLARGVEPERIIFAQRMAEHADHLARLQLADLALDPWPYNSHSSGLDVLWAGVPMITLLGDNFASRVGASLNSAARMRECIAESMSEYGEKCVGLYRQPARLSELKNHLVSGRKRLPLFDMPYFAHSIESLYVQIYNEKNGVRR